MFLGEIRLPDGERAALCARYFEIYKEFIPGPVNLCPGSAEPGVKERSI